MVNQLADSTNSDNTLILNDPYDVMSDTITIGSGSLGQYASAGQYSTTASSMPYGNITINGGGTSGAYIYNTGSGSQWSNVTTSAKHPSISVTGDAEFEGKVKINGQDLAEFMETISKRLAILVPDPEKLEHFEALKKAYDHYKLMEALCQLPTKESK